ncbi:MAG: prephenate dehydrogenase [Verrucomicrobiota bacterium]|nr:prephenate dehydrogenase [Verrucomicrobiota bacterium]
MNKTRKIENIAIIGLGMLGGSLAKTLKESLHYKRIFGCTRKEKVLRTALENNVIDEAFSDPAAALAKADLSVICIPVTTTVDFVKKYASHIKPGAIITDIGSVKSLIVEGCRPIVTENKGHFVGAHPMAGKEFAGYNHSCTDMYEGAIVFLTPHKNDSPVATEEVRKMWKIVKAEPVIIELDKHDKTVAYTSQLIQLLSSAVALTGINKIGHKDCVLAAAGGFKDMTRVASSNVDMWDQIFQSNKDANIEAIDSIIDTVTKLRTMFVEEKWSEIHAFLESAKTKHDRWLHDWQKRF